MMWRGALSAVLVLASFAGAASAETIELRCRQDVSEVYSMSRSGMMSMTYPDDVDVVISLDTETNRATLDQNAGTFDVGADQVLIMMVSDQLKEVWDIDRATGRGLVIAHLIAIARNDRPAASPREISSRSASVNARRDLVLGGGLIPPLPRM